MEHYKFLDEYEHYFKESNYFIRKMLLYFLKNPKEIILLIEEYNFKYEKMKSGKLLFDYFTNYTNFLFFNPFQNYPKTFIEFMIEIFKIELKQVSIEHILTKSSLSRKILKNIFFQIDSEKYKIYNNTKINLFKLFEIKSQKKVFRNAFFS